MNIPISKEELKPFLRRSDTKAWWVVASAWLGIVGIFLAAALLPHWSIYIVAVFLLAGRQQALAAIMHEASHKTLFATRAYNNFVSKWLSSPFLLMDGDTYIKSHLSHHRKAGTNEDPDLPNYKDYPVTRKSLVRKFTRDFLGITGLKANIYLFFSGRDLLSRKKRVNFQLTRGLFVNGIIFSVLWTSGFPQLFSLWVAAYLTVYMAIIRMRQIAEHACVKDLYHLEPKYNTRSIQRGILGFLFVSPTDGLSYHCEHHAFMAVPTYNLRALHQLLKDRGYYDDVEIADGYLSVLKQVVRPSIQG
ncbi:fatty acid desaturase family protein [Microbulbifer sp. OS29]|uniref:Fatty acid desaturase family protein n=1 Tax=Microbulbifer okhotskensis TaxID=2926617 RepID=A0A9X2J9C5_9GAMM|nr:fatty acid desaturase family protein [Microbulbifer okhotskensis]MCO1336496.1 fatty acid desaturase family protein [Microbulbifer okhotskensis]